MIRIVKEDTEFGRALIEGLREALAWKRGEIELQVIDFGPRKRKKQKTKRTSKRKR